MTSTLSAVLLLAATVLASPARDGGWRPGADMPAPAISALAVSLHSGRVLVAGGYTNLYDSPTSNAEIYDPTVATWSRVSSMSVGRAASSATLLRDGRVLVVGGFGPQLKALSTAEVFDPERGTWTLTPQLPATRFSHSATRLPNGTVLIVGGIVSGKISRTTIVYDPDTNSWIPGRPTRHPHALQAAIQLLNGRILITGGFGGGAETYNPRSNSWLATRVDRQRAWPIVVSLVDGTVLVAGGESSTYHDLRSAEIFNPVTGRWKQSGPMNTARNGAAAVRLDSGEILVMGGEQVIGRVLRSAELYEPRSHTWVNAAPMAAARSGALAIHMQDGSVLVCSGANIEMPLRSCETYARNP